MQQSDNDGCLVKMDFSVCYYSCVKNRWIGKSRVNSLVVEAITTSRIRKGIHTMDTHTTDGRNKVKKIDTPGKPYHMECVIHKGKDSEKYIREFERKKASCKI